MRRYIIKRKTRHSLDGLMFVSPFIVGTMAFFLYPIIFSLYISFGEYTIIKDGAQFEFMGITNYLSAFIEDTSFTFIFKTVVSDNLINTPMVVIFSLVIAILLNKKFKGRGMYRTMFFLPFLLGTGYVMQQLLGMEVGTQAMGMARGILLPDTVSEFLGPALTRAAGEFLDRITYVFWRSGVQIIVFLSGLLNINPSLYESAYVDGATEWEMLWKITLPMISPITLLVVIYTVVDSFSDPSNPMVSYFFNKAFREQKFSYSSAMSWIYFLFILIFLAVIYAAIKGFIYSEQTEHRKKRV